MDAILTATAQVLVGEGYDRASTNHIAEVAGVSIGTLYQYFSGKESLIVALMDRHIAAGLEVVRDLSGRLATAAPEEAARIVVRAMLELHGLNPDLRRVLMLELPRDAAFARMRNINRQARLLVQGYLELHRDRIAVPDLELAAFLVVTTVEGVMHAAVIDGRPLDDDALAEQLTRLVLRYLL